MPSETHAPMALQSRVDRTYEVLLHTLPGTRFGLEGRWYILGPFAERLDAAAEYEALCREFAADSLVVVVLVAVVHDDVTGLYRDRILEARGRAPLIRRERMQQLSGQERRRLLAATAPYRRQPRPRPAGPAPEPSLPWAWLVGGTGVLLLLALWLWIAATAI